MSNIEKIRQKIDGLMKETEDSQFDKGERYGLKTVLEFIDSMPEEKPSEDLEEAAEKYIQGSMCDLDDGPTVGLVNEAFIAGAEWQKEQKSAEWSEEDEKDMAHIIRILDDCYVYGTHDLSKTDHENLVNKLKSLRPSWKPNEEQFEALNRCAVYLEESGNEDAEIIKSLFIQLKQL